MRVINYGYSIIIFDLKNFIQFFTSNTITLLFTNIVILIFFSYLIFKRNRILIDVHVSGLFYYFVASFITRFRIKENK